jgi:hypothetical protein
MSDYEHGWTVVECYPNEKGADAIFRVYGVWRTEEEALDYLAECRDDDGAADGDAWTTVRIRVAS